VELPEAVEDLLLTIKGLDDGEIKTRLLQTKVHEMSIWESWDGENLTQKVDPAPKDMDIEDHRTIMRTIAFFAVKLQLYVHVRTVSVGSTTCSDAY
jgi:hypothetical protein